MKPLTWVPEAYPRSGGLAAAGFYKLLGRPRLDPLAVLVRETAQNSWDARTGDGPVIFSVDGWDLLPSEQAALREVVFPQAELAAGTELASGISDRNLTGLYICDRNTKGLGGPLQADEADPEEKYDWVDFVLNVGKANTQGQTGGTYGFGKTISYIVSKVNAVVVHTHTWNGAEIEARFIACAIGDEFVHDGKLRTGRHWWGNTSSGDPSPVVGSDADQLADSIGMPMFGRGVTGTNIFVVAPDFDGRESAKAMNFIAESVTWHLWPKLMSHGDKQPMQVSVHWNGEAVAIPSPSERPPLHGFAQAFRTMLDEEGNKSAPVGSQNDPIWCRRPRTHVGDLVTVPLIQRERAQVDDGHDPEDDDSPRPAAMITDSCHHVALLRSPELVVQYLEGPAPPEGGTEWAGVFRCTPEHDGHFAAAEPPTHDSWQSELLPKSSGRTIVNVALREIKGVLDSRWAPLPGPQSIEAVSTAIVADQLASLVGTVQAQGRGRPTRDQSRIKAARDAGRAKVEYISFSPAHHDGGLATKARFRVIPRAGSIGTRVHVSAGVALDGSASDPELDPGLKLVEARIGDRLVQLTGNEHTIDVEGGEPSDMELLVARSAGTSVLFDVRPEPLDEAT